MLCPESGGDQSLELFDTVAQLLEDGNKSHADEVVLQALDLSVVAVGNELAQASRVEVVGNGADVAGQF